MNHNDVYKTNWIFDFKMSETTIFYRTHGSLDEKVSEENRGYHTWPAENVENDLIFQGGIPSSYLRVENCGFHSYLEVHKGSHNGSKFSMRWEHKNFLLVTLENEDPELIDAFTKVLGQKPFARYVFEGSKEPITFEWDSVNPNKRYETLETDKRRLELKRIE